MLLEGGKSNLIEKDEALEYLRGVFLGSELRKMVNREDSEGITDGTPLSTQ